MRGSQSEREMLHIKLSGYAVIILMCEVNFTMMPNMLLIPYKFRFTTQLFYIAVLTLTLILMEPGGSMPHSQGPSNNPYREPNQPNSTYRYRIH